MSSFNRVKYLQQALEINEVQADLINDLIRGVPDEQIKDFLVWRMNYIHPMMSKELITKNALFDFQKMQTESKLRAGVEVFKTVEGVREYLQKFYRGREITNGAGPFYEHVVIGMDRDGELINKSRQNEHGSFFKLNSEDSSEVYEWLLQNQDRIGVVRYISKPQKRLENKIHVISIR